MKTNTKELTDLLAKLDKLTYIDGFRDKLETKEGFTIFYTTELHSSIYGGFFPSIQFVLNVKYKGKVVRGFGWGCGGDEDTKILVDWFLAKEVKGRDFSYAEETRLQKLGGDILNEL